MKARTALACTVALLAAVLVASEAKAQWGPGWGRGPGWAGPRWGGGYGHGWRYGNGWYGGGGSTWGPQARGCRFGPGMAYWLGLSAAQQDAIDALHRKAMASVMPLWQELDRTEFDLSALVTAQEYDEKVARELRKKARDLDAKIDDAWSKYQEQVLALLTPQQRQEYDRLAVARGPYGGPGYVPGYGWGRGRFLGWERRGCWGGRGWGWRRGGWGW